jgi:hypothetical protein
VWALKIEKFFGLEMATSEASAIWAQKSRYTPPPPHLVRGEDALARGRGGGGQYFGRRQTHLYSTYVSIDNVLH